MIESLPTELIVHIFKYLSEEERRQAAFLCKKFYKIVFSSIFLKRTYYNSKDMLKDEVISLKKYLIGPPAKFLNKFTTVLLIQSTEQIDEFNHLLGCMPSLQCLNLMVSYLTSDIHCSIEIPPSVVHFSHNRNTKRKTFTDFLTYFDLKKGLKHIFLLSFRSKFAESTLLMASKKTLVSLYCSKLVLTNENLNLISLCKNLKALCLNVRVNGFNTSYFGAINEYFSRFQHLKILILLNIDMGYLKKILLGADRVTKFPLIRTFMFTTKHSAIDPYSDVGRIILFNIRKLFPHIQLLYYNSFAFMCTFEEIMIFLNHMPELEFFPKGAVVCQNKDQTKTFCDLVVTKGLRLIARVEVEKEDYLDYWKNSKTSCNDISDSWGIHLVLEDGTKIKPDCVMVE